MVKSVSFLVRGVRHQPEERKTIVVCARLFYLHTRLRLVSRKLSLRDLHVRRGGAGGGARVLKQFIDLYTEARRACFRTFVRRASQRHATRDVCRLARERKRKREKAELCSVGHA